MKEITEYYILALEVTDNAFSVDDSTEKIKDLEPADFILYNSNDQLKYTQIEQNDGSGKIAIGQQAIGFILDDIELFNMLLANYSQYLRTPDAQVLSINFYQSKTDAEEAVTALGEKQDQYYDSVLSILQNSIQKQKIKYINVNELILDNLPKFYPNKTLEEVLQELSK